MCAYRLGLGCSSSWLLSSISWLPSKQSCLLEDRRISWGPSWWEGTHSSDVHGCLRAWNPFLADLSNDYFRASLVAQWLRICLLMQGTRVRALVWEDPTCHGAAGPVSHNY